MDLRLFHKSLHFLRENRSFRSFHPRCPQKEPRNAPQRVVEVELEALHWQLQDILQILPATKLESGNIVLESMLQALILSEFVTSDPNTSQYSMLFWFNSIQPSSTIINHQPSIFHLFRYKILSHSAPATSLPFHGILQHLADIPAAPEVFHLQPLGSAQVLQQLMVAAAKGASPKDLGPGLVVATQAVLRQPNGTQFWGR